MISSDNSKSDKLPETLSLADRTVALYRNTKFMVGTQEVGSGHHMIVQHRTGNTAEVMVVNEDGTDRVKRIVRQMRVQSPSSPALSDTVTYGISLADLDEKTEKRLLEIYKMFAKESAH